VLFFSMKLKRRIMMYLISLLQIFDDGHLADAKGRRVDFRNSIIVMTSNAGAELIKRDMSIGFAAHVDGEGNSRWSTRK